MNRNCNDELVVKIIGKLTMEFRELEVDLPINILFSKIDFNTWYNKVKGRCF